jgi:hypothetical protein
VAGPIFKLIEKAVCKNKHFMKYIPVDKRVDVLNEMCEDGARYMATDFDHYESHFEKDIMEAVEFELYSYMVSKLPCGKLFMKIVSSVLTGVNMCRFKRMVVKVLATRMSGEMNTSLGNGFSNLMLILYNFTKYGVHDPSGYVEGDDSIFKVFGTKHPVPQDFIDIGFSIKLNVYQHIGLASFCGVVFDPTSLQAITDPVRKVLNFSWMGERYINANQKTLLKLLSAKSMSLLVLYPACPIVTSLAKYGIRVSPHIYKVATSTQYEMEEQIYLIKHYINNKNKYNTTTITSETRKLMKEVFGIDEEIQISMENYLDNKTDLSPIDHSGFYDLVNLDCKLYWQDYVSYYSTEGIFPLLRVNSNKNYESRNCVDEEVPTPQEKKCPEEGSADSCCAPSPSIAEEKEHEYVARLW